MTDRGVILVNVLVVLALAASVVVLMLTLQERGIGRAALAADAAQARALARAGEASALALLTADADREVDAPGEAWAQGQAPVEVPGGRFAFRVEDAQGRINLNSATTLQGRERLRGVFVALELPGDLADTVAAGAPWEDLAELGLPAEAEALLAPLLTALPEPTEINLNAAREPVLALLFNPVAARLLAARRAANGALTRADLEAAGIIAPPDVGFASGYYRVVSEGEVGRARRRLDSLIRRAPDGPATVVRRRALEVRGRTAPSEPGSGR